MAPKATKLCRFCLGRLSRNERYIACQSNFRDRFVWQFVREGNWADWSHSVLPPKVYLTKTAAPICCTKEQRTLEFTCEWKEEKLFLETLPQNLCYKTADLFILVIPFSPFLRECEIIIPALSPLCTVLHSLIFMRAELLLLFCGKSWPRKNIRNRGFADTHCSMINL